MTEYMSCAETAKIVRKALKEAFPCCKFSVRSRTYSMGASIDVSWTDGPSEAAVKKVTDRFEGATFDGMTDYKGGRVHEFDGKSLHFGADWIFTTRTLSQAFQDKVRQAYAGMTPKERSKLLDATGAYRRAHNMPQSWSLEDPDLWDLGEDAPRVFDGIARGLDVGPIHPSPTAGKPVVARTY